MILLQNPLFSFEEILSLEPEERLQKIFITLDELPFYDNQNSFRRPRPFPGEYTWKQVKYGEY